MADTIDADQLDSEIMHIISQACEELNNGIAEELTDIGSEAVTELQSTSPKDTGEYSRSWTSTVMRTKAGVSVTVHNRKYQLIHLLENGTANADGTQRTKAQPHIAPVNEKAQRKALKLLGGED
jgi:hypothetical protein